MKPEAYIRLALKASLILAILPVVLAVMATSGDSTFLGANLDLLWVIAAAVAVLLILSVTWLISVVVVRQTSLVGTLLTGFGLPILIPSVLSGAKVLSVHSLLGWVWIILFLSYPVVLGSTCVQGLDGRTLVRRANLAVCSISVPLLWRGSDAVVGYVWSMDRPYAFVFMLVVLASGLWLLSQLPAKPASSRQSLWEALVSAALTATVFGTLLIVR